MVSEKKNSAKPVIIAPSTLVAGKVMASRIIAVSIVPRIPVKNKFNLSQHSRCLSSQHDEVKSVMPKNTVAMPSITQRNAGITTMVALNLKTAAIIPIIMLAIKDFSGQPKLQLQLFENIFFTSVI